MGNNRRSAMLSPQYKSEKSRFEWVGTAFLCGTTEGFIEFRRSKTCNIGRIAFEKADEPTHHASGVVSGDAHERGHF